MIPRTDHPLSILVVDDQPDAADATAAMLKIMGHEARTAYSGPEALEIFREMNPRVVLMDLSMPEMSGFEAAARIRLMPEGPSATIIALTAWCQDGHRRQSHEASIDYFVVKPAEPKALQEVLSRVRVH
jgi:CheY-like chemotaxis protein